MCLGRILALTAVLPIGSVAIERLSAPPQKLSPARRSRGCGGRGGCYGSVRRTTIRPAAPADTGSTRGRKTMLNFATRLTGMGALALALLGGAAHAQEGLVAFLMPDQGSTRYEEHDFPGFKAEMAKLSPEDRKLAEAQVMCAIDTESPLGSSGPIYKVMIKGQAVFLCCKGCEAEAKAHPDETLVKFQQLMAAQRKK